MKTKGLIQSSKGGTALYDYDAKEIQRKYSLYKYGDKATTREFAKKVIEYINNKYQDPNIVSPSFKKSSAIRFLVDIISQNFTVTQVIGNKRNVISTPYSSLSNEARKDSRRSGTYKITGNNPHNFQNILFDDSIVTGATLDVIKDAIHPAGILDKLCLIKIPPENAKLEHSINTQYVLDNLNTFAEKFIENPDAFNFTNYLIRLLKSNEGSYIINQLQKAQQSKVHNIISNFR